MGEMRTNIAPKEVNRDEYTPNTNQSSQKQNQCQLQTVEISTEGRRQKTVFSGREADIVRIYLGDPGN